MAWPKPLQILLGPLLTTVAIGVFAQPSTRAVSDKLVDAGPETAQQGALGSSLKSEDGEPEGRIWLGSWAVEVDPHLVSRNQLETMASDHGLEVIGKVSGFDDTFLLHRRCSAVHRGHCRHRRDTEATQGLLRRIGVRQVEQQHEVSRRRHEVNTSQYRGTYSTDLARPVRSTRYNDPLFSQQWYYDNTQDEDHDAGVLSVWEQGIKGKGVVVCIVDDGIEHDHEDLRDAYDPVASADFNSNDDDPYPREEDPINNHGTRCSGVVGAQPNNNKCGVGVAYSAKVGGIRMLDGPVSDVVEANSLGHQPQHIDIYSSSWGPNDDGRTVEGPGPLASRVFERGVTDGRNGLGSIYLFASGNGGTKDDCNCDGYSNSIYTIAISALTEHEGQPYYSENCAAAMTSTYSSGGGRAIVTTDLHNRCHTAFSGTSAAAPLAAGILALVLEARPDLTWRDVQHVVVRSAVRVALGDSDWTQISSGLWHSHKYGFGKMVASSLVTTARSWQLVGPQIISTISASRPTSQATLAAAAQDSQEVGPDDTNIAFLEHVQIVVSLNPSTGSQRGNLEVFVYCPDGTPSKVLSTRRTDRTSDGFREWTFMTVRCWGTSPLGTWKIKVQNERGVATLESWQLVLYGTKENPIGSSKPLKDTEKPSVAPTTSEPTLSTTKPSQKPTAKPSNMPTAKPSDLPTAILTTTESLAHTTIVDTSTLAPSSLSTNEVSQMPTSVLPTDGKLLPKHVTSSPVTSEPSSMPSSGSTTATRTTAETTRAPMSQVAEVLTSTTEVRSVKPTHRPLMIPPWPVTRKPSVSITARPTISSQSAIGAMAEDLEPSSQSTSLSLNNDDVRKGIIVGLVAALVLVLVAFGIRMAFVQRNRYSKVSTQVSSTYCGNADPYDGSDDWADSMELSSAAFQRAPLSADELEELQSIATSSAL